MAAVVEAAAGQQQPAAIEDKEMIKINLADLGDETRCAVCLGVIKNARLVSGCMHRFCMECIETWLRNTKVNDCPQCRNPMQSRRDSKPDARWDKLMALLYGDVQAYEEEVLEIAPEALQRAQEQGRAIMEAQEARRQRGAGVPRVASFSAAAARSSPALQAARRPSPLPYTLISPAALPPPVPAVAQARSLEEYSLPVLPQGGPLAASGRTPSGSPSTSAPPPPMQPKKRGRPLKKRPATAAPSNAVKSESPTSSSSGWDDSDSMRQESSDDSGSRPLAGWSGKRMRNTPPNRRRPAAAPGPSRLAQAPKTPSKPVDASPPPPVLSLAEVQALAQRLAAQSAALRAQQPAGLVGLTLQPAPDTGLAPLAAPHLTCSPSTTVEELAELVVGELDLERAQAGSPRQKGVHLLVHNELAAEQQERKLGVRGSASVSSLVQQLADCRQDLVLLYSLQDAC